MKRLTTAIVTILILILGFTLPAAAASGDMEMRGFEHRTDYLFIITMRLEFGSPMEADYVFGEIDDDFIEENFDGTVILTEAFTPEMLSLLDAEDGDMYAMMLDDGDMMMLMTVQQGEYIHVLGMLGDETSINGDSGYAFGELAATVILSGDDYDFDVPVGFVEVDLEDEGTSAIEF